MQTLKSQTNEFKLTVEESRVLFKDCEPKNGKSKPFSPVPQVFLSTRRGAWILNRVADQGYPFDVLFNSRLKYFLSKICGQSLANTYLEKRMNQRFNHKMYGLKPKHRYVLRMGSNSQPGLCPDQKANLPPFAKWDNTPAN